MDWIKRNLYFLIGAIVAVALMGMAGFYLYSKLGLNNQMLEQLNEQYAKLDQLNRQDPHPGSPKVDNIAEARRQQQVLVGVLNKLRGQFQAIPAIPDTPRVSSQDFTAALRRTIDYLQKHATNSSVVVPPNYNFSFEAQKPRVSFAPGSLEPLAVQLGEVKAICEVLFAAKVNALDNVRRERVSPDDSGGPATDYLDRRSVTNELAVMAPYEVTFRSFSSELAAVLAGFAGSSNGVLVKTVNVEPAPSSASPFGLEGAMPNPYAERVFAPQPPPVVAPGVEAEAAMMARRYGGGAPGGGGAEFGGGGSLGGVPLGTGPAPAPVYTPQPYAGYSPGGAAAATRGGLPTVLDEKLLRVTLTLDVVKLLPQAQEGGASQNNPGN